MIGLGFLLFFTLWSLGCALVSWLFAKQLPVAWRPWVWLALFFVLTPSILIDEIIGKQQFDRLCQEQTVYIAPDARGRTVYLADTSDEPVKGTWGQIWKHPKQYVDATTGETIVGYKVIYSNGGWFMRALKWNGMSTPFLCKSSCIPENRPIGMNGFKSIGINYIEPPDSQKINRNKGGS